MLAAGLAVAMPAAAQTMSGNVDSIAAALRAKGYSVKTKTSSDSGNPIIDTSFGENANFSVYFYDCTNHTNCGSIQFYAGYTDSKMTVETLNEWNRTKRFGRAYIDSVGDPVVEMDINMVGGLSRTAFEDDLSLFRQVTQQFSNFVYPQ